MTYTKHNFQSGGKIKASDFNELENQVVENEDEITNLKGRVKTLEDNPSGGYEPPVGGIPESDLSADVQRKLNSTATDEQVQSAVDDYLTGKDISGVSFNQKNTLVNLLNSVLFSNENITTKWNAFKDAWGNEDEEGGGEPVDPNPPIEEPDEPEEPPMDDEEVINGFIAKAIPRNTDALDRVYASVYQTQYNDEDYFYLIYKELKTGTIGIIGVETPYCKGWVKTGVQLKDMKENLWQYPSVANSSNYPHWLCVKCDLSKIKEWYTNNEAVNGGKYLLYGTSTEKLPLIYGYDDNISVVDAGAYILKEAPTLEEFLIVKGDAINAL